MRAPWLKIRLGIADLSPGYFGMVMATGTVSQAMLLDGSTALAGVLLAICIGTYGLLAAAFAWRFAGYRERFCADARNPRHSFGYFSFAAGTNVLAGRLATDGHTTAAVALLTVGTLAWLALGYTIPLLVAGTPGALSGVNGTWLLLAVGAESVCLAVTDLRVTLAPAAAALAIIAWAVGVLLYLIIAVVVVVSLLRSPVRPAAVTPTYWVFMGATVICVLGGVRMLQLPHEPLSASLRDLVPGLSLLLWAFGSWLIPLLIAVGVWRHLVRRVSLGYEPGLWSLAFPVAMYGIATRALGAALGVRWLVEVGRYEAWLALGVWVAVAAGLAWTLSALLRSLAAPHDTRYRIWRTG
jgi:tellurite resistance protein TehA-like permease